MKHKHLYSALFLALLIGVITMTPMASQAELVEKNDGIGVDRDADQVKPQQVPPGHPFPVDSRVVAVVDFPSDSDCIRKGDTGTIYCYDPNDPVLPYLVNWDSACGFEQCQVCNRCAPHGWWVGFDEIELIEGSQCPAATALEGDPQKESKLGVLYDFRDEVLASTPTGQRYIELFYQHAEEGVELMLSYPELLSHTYRLLERFLPMIQAAVAGQEVMVTAADLADIEALLEAFAVRASPELEADLRAIGEELRQGRLLEQFGIGVQ